jgi:hypothetical protein
MKLHAEKWPFLELIAALLGWQPSKRASSKSAPHKARPQHRHAAFLELP